MNPLCPNARISRCFLTTTFVSVLVQVHDTPPWNFHEYGCQSLVCDSFRFCWVQHSSPGYCSLLSALHHQLSREQGFPVSLRNHFLFACSRILHSYHFPRIICLLSHLYFRIFALASFLRRPSSRTLLLYILHSHIAMNFRLAYLPVVC